MLTVENFSVIYNHIQDPVPAAMEIDFHLAAGECLGIIGESGCGKTSLALGIMGLLEEAHLRGRVLFQGVDLSELSPARRREYRWQRLAMVFQNSLEVFNPVITIGEQLSEPLRSHLGLSAKEAGERVEEMLTLTGLDPQWQTAYAHELSGGMRQRVLIAMALACRPELLIVDEPTTALDAQGRLAILDLLEAMQQRLGFAMILISHNLPAVQRLTSRLATMYGGRLVEQGDTAEVLRRPLHPYTRGLINASPDFFQYKDLWGIAGAPPRPGGVSGCVFAPRCCQTAERCGKESPLLETVTPSRAVACHLGGIQTVLEGVGLQKDYRVGDRLLPALKGVDLTVRRGEVVALVGRSGSGKSTLAQILTWVLPADHGEVHFLGQTVQNGRASAVMGGMQMVFQDPSEAVSHRFTVLAAVREPLDIMGWGDQTQRDDKAVAALMAMHLPTEPDFLARRCSGLSGGQRQRLAIARALVTDPAMLVADEITSLLDPSTQAVIMRELKEQQHRRGFSMLFITHDLNLARKVADRVYVLDQGAMVEEGAAFEIFATHQADAATDATTAPTRQLLALGLA